MRGKDLSCGTIQETLCFDIVGAPEDCFGEDDTIDQSSSVYRHDTERIWMG